MFGEIWGKIPEDLEHIIFEHAAAANRADMLSLTRVSKNVQSWVEPILYEFVSLRTQANVNNFLYAVRHKPLDFMARSVKRLFIGLQSELEYEQLAPILSTCLGLSCISFENLISYPQLGIDIRVVQPALADLPRVTLIGLLTRLPLVHLQMHLGLLRGTNARGYLYDPIQFSSSSITHLLPHRNYITDNAKDIFNLFPSLTHLFLRETATTRPSLAETIDTVLKLSSFQVLVIARLKYNFPPDTSIEETSVISSSSVPELWRDDPRIVCLSVHPKEWLILFNCEEYGLDWIWEFADAAIAKRRLTPV